VVVAVESRRIEFNSESYEQCDCNAVQNIVNWHPSESVFTIQISVRGAHAVASESAISDHVTAPELPEPATTCSFTHASSPRLLPSRFPRSSPASTTDQTLPPWSQTARLTTHQALSAAGTRIALIGSANVKNRSRCRSMLYAPHNALANRPEVRTHKEN